MMDHLVVATEFGIFVFYSIKTMRAGSNDFFYSVSIHYLNVVHGLHLEKKLIPGPSCRIACAGFFGAEHSKFYIYGFKNFNKCPGYPFVPVVKRTSTADPE